jgi:hypothetical protein
VSISTYTELRGAVGGWLNRHDLTDVIPSFISLAEARLNRELRVRQMVKRSVAILEDNYITLPFDWLEAKNVQINVGGRPKKLEYMTLEQGDDYNTRRGGASSGEPLYFNVTGNQLETIPRPSGEPQIELTYYAKIPALSDSAPTNWLLLQWPDLYLYGTLAHSAPYLKDDERVATWAELYLKAMDEVTLSDQRAQYSGSVLKSRARTLG